MMRPANPNPQRRGGWSSRVNLGRKESRERPACETCNGTGHKLVVEGPGVLRDTPCGECEGRGSR